ncbi:ParB/RepB/Spo0J family partition protein [Streptomyces sp. NBC_01320]|uniref:ParB/RepB/Spo0J family partition protein n=1 Tax=Streptomyces sp. NBC_01320 TaxID=2903824 RepID=UPI002E0DFA0C|nr:ParB/RepB/Spo0J family partition protein [Streptomyces sp. NBC_01320]
MALKELAHNPFNPRDELTEIDETAGSLKEKGQLQPVAVVRRAAFLAVHPGQEEETGEAEYVVIDGNRRLAAAAVAGLAELRIDVNDDLAVSAEDILEGALIANVHRVDVPPLDQAKAIKELLSKHASQEKVAKRLGKSGAWVSQRLALLGLSEDLQEKVEAGELTVKDGRRIGRLPAEQQQTEAAAALNRVKAPRKPRAKNASDSAGDQSASPIPPQNSGTATVTDPAPEGLNPVKGEPEPVAGPDLPWEDPTWFNDQLRAHMSAEHREELVLLLMADG